MRKPLPSSQLTLPGGFTIHIKYKTNKQVTKSVGETSYGYWYQPNQRKFPGGVIVINRDEPAWRQLRTFGHELVHAVHDYDLFLGKAADLMREEGEETLRALKEDE